MLWRGGTVYYILICYVSYEVTVSSESALRRMYMRYANKAFGGPARSCARTAFSRPSTQLATPSSLRERVAMPTPTQALALAIVRPSRDRCTLAQRAAQLMMMTSAVAVVA
jgi:hypothetical protein